MADETLDTSIRFIKDFIDSIDIVLNSNTFLLTFEIVDDTLVESFKTFIKSKDFITKTIYQDSERDWLNLQCFDSDDNCYKIRPGNLVSETAELKISLPEIDKREYLIAMLTGDTSIGSFFSFYSYRKERAEAEMIIDNFVSYLLTDSHWNLFIVQPNFLKDRLQEYAKGDEIKYFDGDYGNDTATLIQSGNKGFLILTNGTD